MSSFENKIISNIERSLKHVRESKGVNSQMPTNSDLIEVTSKAIKKVVPKDRVFEFNECIEYVSNKTNLDGQLVAKGLVKAIDKKDLIAVNNKSGLWLRKNEI